MTADSCDNVESDEGRWVLASMVLIERDGTAVVPVRTLTTLISYALANPSDDLGARLRDEAVDRAHDAIAVAFESQTGSTGERA